MEARLARVIAIGVVIGAVAAIGFTELGVLPRVIPPAVVEAKGTVVSPPTRSLIRHASSPAVSGPPYAIEYSTNDLLQLHQLSQSLHWQPWLPTKALQLDSYVESYVSQGVLSVIIGPYLLEESNHPLSVREAPTSVTPVTLPNGDAGSWWWVPGEGGSYYRLNLQMGSIYVRIAGSNSLATLSQLAESFQPLMGLS